MALDHALVFELSEAGGEQPVGDAGDRAPVLRESAGAAHPGEEDGGVPLTAREFHGALEAAARGFVDMPELVQACAVLVEVGDLGHWFAYHK